MSAMTQGHKISINFKLGCYSSNLFLVAKAKPFDFLDEFGADQVAETWASLVQAQVESSPHREAILKEVKEFQVATQGKAVFLNIVPHSPIKAHCQVLPRVLRT
mmetsp:Transcript_41564/g.63432  ORF Transcript_41564/g.63432 Transcript_41564/m.63432 type:complete len:104 (+) Transcript_41564:672-983(+)